MAVFVCCRLKQRRGTKGRRRGSGERVREGKKNKEGTGPVQGKEKKMEEPGFA